VWGCRKWSCAHVRPEVESPEVVSPEMFHCSYLESRGIPGKTREENAGNYLPFISDSRLPVTSYPVTTNRRPFDIWIPPMVSLLLNDQSSSFHCTLAFLKKSFLLQLCYWQDVFGYDWWDSNIRRATIGWIWIRSKKGYDWWDSNIRRATIGWIHNSIVR
jgi:hypothetical protein